ncbi:hypothetical protein THAOC_34257 [Thalassiosira oceanica]|uniref:N-acetyltransferase domain-containing protein n=1 Tax=Thalassiosira oceanica TaxID=159749 RepID=K0RD77_THAOC|nr:hypothetical protein THAOC_34257 [Thalassiosira oceanica]|mmetsp:Transcript_20337/g.47763  ORF Transcript_20337/g.47763 Transcript_20337/m.47763 type:complete len:620 (+) Transcript_20337:330-2189(+)|eukprot:EJK47051.1 hypothetical protein THAOC_34257 [Thalassiosira oceanica]
MASRRTMQELQLKFRSVQPVDIERIAELEADAFPPEVAESKSDLQGRQHYGAAFFRCVLLKNSKELEEVVSEAMPFRQMSTEEEACHHVMHDGEGNELIGYVSASRCDEFVSSSIKLNDESQSLVPSLAYPCKVKKREPNGRYLAIHSVVVQREYQRLGVAKSLLQNYVKSVEKWNEDDESSKKRSNSKMERKIEKIIVLCRSSVASLFVSSGFRWRQTVSLGCDSYYEMEKQIQLSNNKPASIPREFYLVNSFALPGISVSGNPAAIIVLPDDDYSGVSDEWMMSIARQFNQPSTVFAWRLDDKSVASSISDDVLNVSNHGEDDAHQNNHHFYVRFFNPKGECNMCAHAAFGLANVLFRHFDEGTDVVSFHNRTNIILQARPYVSSQTRRPSYLPQQQNTVVAMETKKLLNNTDGKIRMDYPWRDVVELPRDGQKAILAMLRRAFFSSHSVVDNDDDDDSETDEVALSLSSSQILFAGATENNEDLLVEVEAEMFDTMLGRNVDYSALKHGYGYTRGIIVCCSPSVSISEQFNTEVDFRSRYFQPRVGVNEDVASGWPQCALAPYFHSKNANGKNKLVGLQQSERGGLIECILNKDEETVGIVGLTVTTLKGVTLIGE